MAENIPNIPSGAVPPKKETGKVQPKKETVRINLPPKPSAAPTIKLPTLPPGGPTGGPSPAAPARPRAPRAAHPPSAPRATARRAGGAAFSAGCPAPGAGARCRPARRQHAGHDPGDRRSGRWTGWRWEARFTFGSFCRTCERALICLGPEARARRVRI